MARSTNQKLKILYIIRLLAGTDEAHVATMADILEELKSRGISAERKSIYDDIAALRSFGLDIVNRRERPAGYYLRDKASLSAVGMAPAAEDSERSGPAGETESAGEEGAAGGSSPAEADQDHHGTGGPQETGEHGTPGETGITLPFLTGKTKVELSCREEVADRILHQLEGNASVRGKGGKKNSPEAVSLKCKVEPDETFYGWLAGFGCQVKIQAPSQVIREYRRYLKEIRNMYKDE